MATWNVSQNVHFLRLSRFGVESVSSGARSEAEPCKRYQPITRINDGRQTKAVIAFYRNSITQAMQATMKPYTASLVITP